MWRDRLWSVLRLLFDAFKGGFRAIPTLAILSPLFDFGVFVRALIERWNDTIPKVWTIVGLNLGYQAATGLAICALSIPLYISVYFNQKVSWRGDRYVPVAQLFSSFTGLIYCFILSAIIISGGLGYISIVDSDTQEYNRSLAFLLAAWMPLTFIAAPRQAAWIAAWCVGVVAFDRCELLLGPGRCELSQWPPLILPGS